MLFLKPGHLSDIQKQRNTKVKYPQEGNVERIYNSNEKKALKAMQEAVKRELNLMTIQSLILSKLRELPVPVAFETHFEKENMYVVFFINDERPLFCR
ncbi:hypothetical protein P7H21_25200 [Paenibacillus larvae]|nr:hypothetical protein [Paenibacillus larvae]MDT2306589.1 hypothetical protein [Paenibacillus larvae]